jgi:UDP-N-acetylglucosamine 2-epimerase
MDKIFFDELGIPEPDYSLEVGSGSHGWQTGEMLKKAEDVLIKERPGWVLVYGDTNSTLAGALAASKLHIPLAHIEAGLRSYNKRMPEETNRILTDHCSNMLFCPTENAVRNLQKEGFKNIINNGKLINFSSFQFPISDTQSPAVINVGDIMYDALLMSLKIAEKKSNILENLKIKPREYYLATVHRAENTDDKDRMKKIIQAFIEISKEKPLIFPIHPRTKKILEKFNSSSFIHSQVYLIEPLSYFDMLILEKNAARILTDSGGMQKEAYLLEVPCLTLRKETEWVETVESGWNVLVSTDKKKMIDNLGAFKIPIKEHRNEYYGNGSASSALLNILIGLVHL